MFFIKFFHGSIIVFISYVVISFKKPAVSSLDFKRPYKMVGNYLHIDDMFSERKRRGQLYLELL